MLLLSVYEILDNSYTFFTGGNYFRGLKDIVYLMSEKFSISLEKEIGSIYISSNTGVSITSIERDDIRYNEAVKNVKVGYPTSLSTNYKFDEKTKILEVCFDVDYGGRIFEFNK